jgi:hypothetical protein
MDYSVCEDTQAIVDLSRKIFADAVDDAALTQHDGQIDQALWQTSADAGLIGLHMPESAGGLGLSFETLCRVLEQLGRINAPIPLLQSALAGTVVAKSRCCGSVDSVLAGDACFALSLSDGLDCGRRTRVGRCRCCPLRGHRCGYRTPLRSATHCR